MLTHIEMSSGLAAWWKSRELWIHYWQRLALLSSPIVETDVGNHGPFYSEGNGYWKVLGAWRWSLTFIKCRREVFVELDLPLSLMTCIATVLPLILYIVFHFATQKTWFLKHFFPAMFCLVINQFIVISWNFLKLLNPCSWLNLSKKAVT